MGWTLSPAVTTALAQQLLGTRMADARTTLEVLTPTLCLRSHPPGRCTSCGRTPGLRIFFEDQLLDDHRTAPAIPVYWHISKARQNPLWRPCWEHHRPKQVPAPAGTRLPNRLAPTSLTDSRQPGITHVCSAVRQSQNDLTNIPDRHSPL